MGLFSSQPEPSTPTIARPEVGTVNVLEASIGARGQGKSTYQAYRALILSRSFGGAYVIGHSLGARLPSRLPPSLGGEKLPIVYHPSISKLASGLRRHPDKWHVLAPPLSGKGSENPDTADDLLRYAVELSTAIRKAAWQRAYPFRIWKSTVSYEGVHCPPVIVVVDEGIAIESAGPSRKEGNRWFLSMLYSLRHYHIALLYSIQDPSARSWRILEQATSIHVFRLRHRWAIESIRAAGASDEEVARISQLPQYEHVTLSWEDRDDVALDDEGVREQAEAAFKREK